MCCRVRPLLPNEVAHGVPRAPWVLTEKSIALKERSVGRQSAENWRDAETQSMGQSFGTATSKTRGELRNLEHLRRNDGETIMDCVFGETATTQQVYEQSFKNIVAGTAEGMNGAILAYGQTSSGKTYSISGSTARNADGDETEAKGIIHFALEDLFGQLHEKAVRSEGTEFLVRMSFCEVYMERVNDLLRKIGPQSQNLPVREDPEGKGFFADGLKEKIVGSADEVVTILREAEKRRRVAHTRYNEVSSRSHTLMTLCVECSTPLEACAAATGTTAVEDGDNAPVMTRVGRLVIVDLAGNEKVEAGTEYMAESSSINKSLFFLGKVIEKLSARDKRGGAADDGEHVPFRDSKLTRLLSVHLGGNSQTGLLVALCPTEEAVEQSMTTLRFAQKASLVKCTAKPVLISKEQSLIVKQREIIAHLNQQVQSLQEEVQQRAALAPEAPAPQVQAQAQAQEELAAERQHRAEQLQALVVSKDSPESGGQDFVSKSREVDTVVTALHRNNEVLKKQKATVVESLQQLYKAVNEVATSTARAAEELAGGTGLEGALEVMRAFVVADGSQDTEASASARKSSAAWAPAIQQLREKVETLVEVVGNAKHKEGDLERKLAAAQEENQRLINDAKAVAKTSGSKPAAAPVDSSVAAASEEQRQLKEENSKLRQGMKFITEERERLQKELADFKAQLVEAARDYKNSPKPLDSCSETTSSWRPPRTPSVDASSASKAGSAVVETPRYSSSHPGHSSRMGTSSASKNSSFAKPGVGGQDLQPEAHSPLGDFEPIFERGASNVAPRTKGASSSSPLRRTGGLVLSKSGSLGEFEPIIERGIGAAAAAAAAAGDGGGTRPQPPLPGAHLGAGARRTGGSPSRPLDAAACRPPAPGAEVGGKLSQAYFRNLGAAKQPRWPPGDLVYWRGQACRVVRGIPEDQPLCVVIRTPRGSEVTTDTCLLSEGPSTAAAASSSASQQPLRLTPLNDLFLDRPGAAVVDRPPALPQSPRAFSHGALPAGGGTQAPAPLRASGRNDAGRPASRERSGGSSGRGRASGGSPMRFVTPPLCPAEAR